MHRKQLINDLYIYQNSSLITHEEQDMVSQFLQFVNNNSNCFERSCVGHVTGSAWIINNEASHVLLTHHRKFKKWFQLGGHADGEFDSKKVALKEAEEESGLTDFVFIIPTIFDIDVHPLPTACAYHYDVRYLLQASKNQQYVVSEESLDLAWVPFNELPTYTTVQSLLRMHKKAQVVLKVK